MTEPSSWAHWIGRRETRIDHVTPALVERLRATIDLGPDVWPQPCPTPAAGLHWCLALPDAPTALLNTDGHPRPGGLLPPLALPRRMWAASDVTFHAPLPPQAAIMRETRIAAIRETMGRAGPLTFVDLDHGWTSGPTLILNERQTLVFREAAKPRNEQCAPAPQTPPPAPAWALAATDWPVQHPFTASTALIFRYSALTFNAHRIHYDAPYARDAEGYPGLVVQGPLLATLLINLAAQLWEGAQSVARFKFRAVAPSFVDEPLILAARHQPEDQSLSLAVFNPRGLAVEARAERR